MFNFKNSNAGKIRVKLLATLLVLTLTFANFALVGSYIGEAIAAEIDLKDQNDNTDNENVKFELYFAENNSNKISKDMNATDLVLKAKVSVNTEGVLENAKLELTDTNFELREDESLDIGTIQADGYRELTLPIQMKKDGNTFNLGLLDMMSKITLTGSYKTETGIENINTLKYVQVNWTSEAIEAIPDGEPKPIELTQELITNKIYNIAGTNKRVIQYKITSGITDNKYPIKATTIELQVPAVEENMPEEVVVAAYSLNATNPNERLNFKEYDEENPNNAYYSFNQETGKVNINITNNENDNNEITWNKEGQDEFVVTYIYSVPQDVEITEIAQVAEIESVINSEIALHDLDNREVRKETTLGKTNVQELSNIISLNTKTTENIYKGNMYIGEDTDYKTASKIYISYGQVLNDIVLEETESVLPEGLATYYKTTKINKADALKVLGTQGKIVVYDGENKIDIDLSEEIEEDYYTISYENNVNKLEMVLTPAQSEGTIEIINEKVIKVIDVSKVSEATELKLNTILTVRDTENKVVDTINLENIENLKRPDSEAEFDVTNINGTKNFATLQQNDISFTVTLKTDDIKYNLYDAPEIVITLPDVVEKIENVNTVMMNKNALDIESATPENNTIKIKLSGKQESYTNLNEQISVNAKITTNKLIPTVAKDIVMTVTNGEEVVRKTQTVNFEAESGVLLATSVSNYNSENKTITSFGEKIATGILETEKEEKTLATVKGTVINNTKSDLEEIKIFGKVQNSGTSINTALNTEILVTKAFGENANLETITYYTEDANPSLESNWGSIPTENTTAYLIVCKNFAKATVIEFGYGVVMPENLDTNKETVINYEVYSNNQKSTAPEVKLQTPKEVKLDLELTASVQNGQEVYEGQNITYNVKVKNTGEVDAENVKLNINAEGLTIVEGANQESLNIKVGETKEIQIKATVNKEVSSISFSAEAKTDYLLSEAKAQIANTVTKPGIELEIKKLISTYSEYVSVAQLGSSINYQLKVTNTSNEDIKDIEITYKLAEELQFEELYIYKNSGTGLTPIELNDNYNEQTTEINVQIDNLKSGEQVLISIYTNVEKAINSNIVNLANVIANEKYPDVTFNITDTTNVIGVSNVTSSISSNAQATLNAGDIIEYTIKVKNDGETAESITVEDNIPQELEIQKAYYYYTEGEKREAAINLNNVSLNSMELKQNQELTIKIKAKVKEIEENTTIENYAKITGIYTEQTTDIIRNTVIGTGKKPSGNEGENSGNGSGDNSGNGSGNQSGTTEFTYSISGIAWQDDNSNGARENEEKLLSGIVVKIINAETNEYLLDEQGQEINQTTNENGIYEFVNLKPGKYIVVFDYNKTTYSPATYQKENVENTINSDARLVTEENNNIVKTDILEITNQNISNIDIGLILNPIFDLRLDKYITKVTVQNERGTKIYEYDKTQLAKVEIPAKVLEGSLIIIEYQIDVTNEGAIPAHVDTIVDYVSPQFEFISELNTTWYQGEDKNLYCIEFANEDLEPGKTVSTKLVLTKTMTNDNTGLVNNAAEIYETFNEYAYEDIDSIPANRGEEDDLSQADIIISIQTGGPMLYIGIVIITMIILSAGIYLINKKVIKNHII